MLFYPLFYLTESGLTQEREKILGKKLLNFKREQRDFLNSDIHRAIAKICNGIQIYIFSVKLSKNHDK